MVSLFCSLGVEAVIDNHDRLLRPGMFANARINTGDTRRTAVVPPGAILVEAGVHRVFVVHDGAIEERVVTILERNAERVVIGDGLQPGEQVATERLSELADGMRVAGPAPSAPKPPQPPKR